MRNKSNLVMVLFTSNPMTLLLKLKETQLDNGTLRGLELMTSSIIILLRHVMTYDFVSVLHVAAVLGDTLILESLIQRGAVVNATDYHGQSALHVACQRGRQGAAVST